MQVEASCAHDRTRQNVVLCRQALLLVGNPSPAATATALVLPALSVWRALEAHGMDPAAIFRAAGVDPEALRVPGKRIPLRVAQRLWRVVDEGVGDPGFGIAVAKQMLGTAFYALGYAWPPTATLR